MKRLKLFFSEQLVVKTISKNDTLIFKGIGILLILLHNFFRWVNPITGESEFFYNNSAASNTIGHLIANPFSAINVLMNYFGHYGVQIFVFISAYGLTRSYGHEEIQGWRFVYNRWRKLYPSLLVAVFIYVLFQIIYYSKIPFGDDLHHILIHLSLSATLLPNHGLALNGPWWFYSMIFQLYILFPLVIKLFKRFGNVSVLLLGLVFLVASILINKYNAIYKINMLETFVGQMPVFALGIYFGFKNHLNINKMFLLLIAVVFILGCIYEFFWPLTHLSIVLLFIFLIQHLNYRFKPFINLGAVLAFVGSISVYIFAIHGFLRWPFVGRANEYGIEVFSVLLALLFLVLVIIISYTLTKTESAWRLWAINSKGRPQYIYRSFLPFVLMIGIVFTLYSFQQIKYFGKVNGPVLVDLIDTENADTTKSNITREFSRSGRFAFKVSKENIYADAHYFNLDHVKSKNISKAVIKAYVLSVLPEGGASLVMEPYLRNHEIRLGWNSVNLEFGPNNINTWQNISMEFPLNQFRDYKNLSFKCYVYSPNGNTFFVDDMSLEVYYAD